jgi:hypothetical protein
MKKIEDKFQSLASKVVDGVISEIGDAEKGVVDLFYALWLMRVRHKTLPSQEIQANGATGGGGLTGDQEETVEITGGSFMRSGGKFVARQVNGIQLQLFTYRYADALQHETRWGIMRAQSGEFVVPNAPARFMIPLTPRLCLISGVASGTILQSNVAAINRIVRATSREYFSREICRAARSKTRGANGTAAAIGSWRPLPIFGPREKTAGARMAPQPRLKVYEPKGSATR